MQKSLAVLLLRMVGAPDQPSVSYAEQLFTTAGAGTRNLVEYFADMSHGLLDLGGSQVFGWIDYGHTNDDLAAVQATAKADRKAELLEAGLSEQDADEQAAADSILARRNTLVTWAREAAAAVGIVLDGFIPVCLFNQPVDYWGRTGEAVVNWDSSNNHRMFSVDLTGVAHEVGHALGLMSHSRLEGSADEYADRWDVMSAYDGVYRDTSGLQAPPPASSRYLSFGPGLNAVNMEIGGWLDQRRLFTSSGSAVVRLRPLHDRNLEGWLAARLEVGAQTLYVEFRMNDGWDVRIPQPCILLHRRMPHPSDGLPCSELVLGRPDLTPKPRAQLLGGESWEVGEPRDPFAFHARISVVDIDAENREALVNVHIRQRRRVEPEALVLGGVAVDGGGLIFVPGRGWKRVPPRSPLVRTMALLAEVSAIDEIEVGEHPAALQQASLSHLVAARDHLSAVITARQAPRVPAAQTVRPSDREEVVEA